MPYFNDFIRKTVIIQCFSYSLFICSQSLGVVLSSISENCEVDTRNTIAPRRWKDISLLSLTRRELGSWVSKAKEQLTDMKNKQQIIHTNFLNGFRQNKIKISIV